MDLITDQVKQRDISAAHVAEFARKVGADTFETSAKTGQNINELFNKIASDYLSKKKGGVAGTEKNSGGGVELAQRPGAKQQPGGGGCCG